MKEKHYTGDWKKSMTKAELERFRNMKDEDIDTSDIPELDERFWELAQIIRPQKKIPISLRVDDNILAWFKKQGPGYQSRINAALKVYMAAHAGKEKRR